MRPISASPKPPQFYLKGEIPLRSVHGGVKGLFLGAVSALVTALVLGGIGFSRNQTGAGLAALLAISAIVAVCYFGIRWIGFRAAHNRARTGAGADSKSQGVDTSRELPRNAYLAALLVPAMVLPCTAGLFFAFRWLGAVELALAIGVTAALAVRDVEAAFRLLRIDKEYWIAGTTKGLDVLRPFESEPSDRSQ